MSDLPSCSNHDFHSHSHDDSHESGSAGGAASEGACIPGCKRSPAEKAGEPCRSQNHHHADARKASRKKLLAVIAMSGSFLIVEAAAGFWTGSLALIADAGHMLGDVAALALAFFAIWLAGRPAGPSRTYGYHRSEILAALANSVLLVVISLFILFEAMQRFAQPPQVMSSQMLVVAVIGLCINLISIHLLSDSHAESLNTRAAYLEVVSDMLASVGVILTATVMMTTGWYIADPVISMILALFIIWRTWGLLKESIDILMESAPENVDLQDLSGAILEVDGVLAVHDMHVWTITSGIISMSAHVTIGSKEDPESLLDRLEHLLDHHFGITHTTIQLETESASKRCNDICEML
jgi:cobalt-zinc-cadmium efflux system protein